MNAQQTSSKKINTAIRSVATTGARFNNLVQDTAVAIIMHAKEYGDCTGAARLIDAMPNSARRGLVVDFFTRFSPINVTKGDGGKMKANLRETGDKLYNNFDVDGAKANPWFESAKKDKELEAALNPAAVRSKLYALVNTLENSVNKIANDDDKIASQALLTSVRLALLPAKAA